VSVTPMLQQYRDIKAQHRDAILLYRLGDFYEMFGDDALAASRILEIVLTKRDFGGNTTLPMCGVPHHSADSYIAKLLEAGNKVAVAEQTEEPAKGKKLVNREVVRIITPGTDLDPDRLDAGRNNYLMSVVEGRDRFGIGMLDVSTGEFSAGEVPRGAGAGPLFREVERIDPKECIFSAADAGSTVSGEMAERFSSIKINNIDILFDPSYHRDSLCDHFGTKSLRGFGIDELPLAIMAAGQILEYVKENLKTPPKHINSISLYVPHEHMYLDQATRRNLELTETIREGAKKGSLLWVIDRTCTPMGKRTIRRWLERPLLDASEVNLRLDAVGELAADPHRRADLFETLEEICDLERLSSRVATGLITPKELLAIRDSLAVLPSIAEQAGALKSGLFSALRSDLDLLDDIFELLKSAISDDAPRSMREGGIIRQGYDEKVDELRGVKKGGRNWIVELEARERENSGIKSLKVGYNKVFGYYIEVTKSNLHLVPGHFIRKQTLVNCERFFTEELKEKELSILGAEGKLNDLEYRLFCEIREKVSEEIPRILRAARVVAVLDALSSLAETAAEYGYTRPNVSTSETLRIENGRHPVLERTLPSHSFIPNDTHLNCSSSQVHIITGPNMSGKSTYMRQVALIVLLAQMGGFVPCDSADIGIVDRIFTRVGAVDDIALGMSTFMVEMVETSVILNNATKRGLILLDEVGRGTGTTDGVSIAWAVAEYIHERVGAKTLFATHFNEMTGMEEHYERIKNYHVSAYEKAGEIVFTHKLREGGTDRSFGVEVAKMAGIPASVIRRSAEIMAGREGGETIDVPEAGRRQLSLVDDRPPSRIEEILRDTDLDNLTPRKALDLLFRLRELLDES